MLGSAGTVETLAEALQRVPTKPYVLDPVLVATSGHALADDTAAAAIAELLVPLATVVTPNLDARPRALPGWRFRNAEDMERAGRAPAEAAAPPQRWSKADTSRETP